MEVKWWPHWLIIFLCIFFSKSDLINCTGKENSRKLVVHQYDIPYLSVVIQNYSRLRDYCRTSSLAPPLIWEIVHYPMVIVVNTIAEGTNATLVSPTDISINESLPQIHVASSAFWMDLYDYKNDSYNFTDKLPTGVRIAKVMAPSWSFVYCDVTIKEKISLWDFTLFTTPFDWWTWLVVVTAYLFVVPLTGNISRVLMPTLSATLSFGTTGPPTKSIIFFIWMVTCMLLTNLYSGEITSTIMVPPKDRVMTEFSELLDNNYTSLLPAASSVILSNQDFSLSPFQSFMAKSNSPTGRTLRSLLEKVVILDVIKIPETIMSDDRDLAVIGPWPGIHEIFWTTKYIASKHNLKVERKCHVGKEMAHMSERFFVFLPPENSMLVRAFRVLQESGIFQRWDDEGTGLMHSLRVQERVRFKSPTKILEDGPLPKSPGLEGKMVTLFLLWGVCITTSIVGFCLEVMSKRFGS